MKLIAAVDENWGIGYQGRLLTRISADQKHFKEMTMGHVVILGRKTLEEFPGGRPLAGRTNIILSRNTEYQPDGAIVVHSIEELYKKIVKYDRDDLYVIGGESVYRLLVPYCDTGIITKISRSYTADAFLPNLDRADGWKLESEDKIQEEKGISFRFCLYRNKNPKKLNILTKKNIDFD